MSNFSHLSSQFPKRPNNPNQTNENPNKIYRSTENPNASTYSSSHSSFSTLTQSSGSSSTTAQNSYSYQQQQQQSRPFSSSSSASTTNSTISSGALAITKLNELVQLRKGKLTFVFPDLPTGPSHMPTFTAIASLLFTDDEAVVYTGNGDGFSKKDAKGSAAYSIYTQLKTLGIITGAENKFTNKKTSQTPISLTPVSILHNVTQVTGLVVTYSEPFNTKLPGQVPHFYVELSVNENERAGRQIVHASGSGYTKMEAKHDSSKRALTLLGYDSNSSSIEVSERESAAWVGDRGLYMLVAIMGKRAGLEAEQLNDISARLFSNKALREMGDEDTNLPSRSDHFVGTVVEAKFGRQINAECGDGIEQMLLSSLKGTLPDLAKKIVKAIGEGIVEKERKEKEMESRMEFDGDDGEDDGGCGGGDGGSHYYDYNGSSSSSR